MNYRYIIMLKITSRLLQKYRVPVSNNGKAIREEVVAEVGLTALGSHATPSRAGHMVFGCFGSV